MSLLEESESLRVPFGDIKEATKNFTTLIGKGGYGLVYKGEILLSGTLTTVAVKRLRVSLSGQGLKEFLTEIQLLTRYKHPNLISLVGFCYEGEEKILIYEYAEHGSLDKYLSTAENRRTLTWKQRLDICVNVAHGLNYLHYEAAAHERVIHRDIKSANILLDQNWKAMISDLGLSKLARANDKDSYLITNASGTYGYCDPAYTKSGILTKESDVYSFGVVLFEVLCGRLCFVDVQNEHRFLPQLAESYYRKGQINEIMDPELQNQLDSDSLNKFSEIAFKCIHNSRNKRPSMHWVLKQLKELNKFPDFEVANVFVEQYFHILHEAPDLLYKFYKDISKIGRPREDGTMSITTTVHDINSKILSLNYDQVRAEINSVDSQDSMNGGVSVLVTGYMTGKNNVRQKFIQSFFLAPQQKGYFVLNDIFRYVDDAFHTEGKSASSVLS